MLIKKSIRKCLLYVTRTCALIFMMLWAASNFTLTRVKVQTNSPVCCVQIFLTPQGFILLRSLKTGRISVTTEHYPVGLENRNWSGGVFSASGDSEPFFDSWPVNYWFEPRVVPNESLLSRAGFISTQHWIMVLLSTMAYLLVRFFVRDGRESG